VVETKEKPHISRFELNYRELRKDFDPDNFGFDSTGDPDIEPLEPHVFINQRRAERSLEVGLSTPGHVFVVERNGTVSTSLKEFIHRIVSDWDDSRVRDLVCVYNFDQPEKPQFIELQKGKAVRFKNSVGRLLEVLKREIPLLTHSDTWIERRKAVTDDCNAKINTAEKEFWEELKSAFVESKELGRICFMNPTNDRRQNAHDDYGNIMIFAGLRKKELVQGENPEGKEVETFYPLGALLEFTELPVEAKERIEGQTAEKSGELKIKYSQMTATTEGLKIKVQKELSELGNEFVDVLFEEESKDILKESGESAYPFIDELRKYTVEHKDDFLLNEDNSQKMHPMSLDPFLPFQINVFVDNSKTQGIPVVVEQNPIWGRLFGEVGYRPTFGGVSFGTHMSVSAGALSKAHRGVLVLPAKEALYAWDRMRGVLESKKLDIGETPSGKGIINPESLDVDIHLVFVGDVDIYRKFNYFARSDFEEVFGEVAEFDWEAPRDEETAHKFARLIKAFCIRGGLPQVDKYGVARVLEHMSRLVDNQEEFSLDFRSMKDILNEAANLATKESDDDIRGKHITDALSDRISRRDLMREKIYRAFEDGQRLVNVTGSRVAMINALAALDTGRIKFGFPIVISASSWPDKFCVVNAEEEVGMSGPSQQKSVLILEGFIRKRFGYSESPLAVGSQLVFEQSYGGVDGDSATAAQYCVWGSEVSGVELKQNIALTGSSNQRGDIQPVGGVNEKIEGLFDVCRLMSDVSNDQGVIIPELNRKNLMLRQDVVDAVKEGKFHIYAVSTLDEAMEIMTGMPAGELDPNTGEYPEDSVNGLISAGNARNAEIMRKRAQSMKDKDKEE